MADKEVKVRITGDMSDLLGKLNQLEDAFNDLGKERINNTSVNDLIDDYQRLNKEAREYNENFDDFRGSQRKLDNGNISDTTKQYSDASKHLERYTDQVKDFVREASSMDDFMSFDDIDNTIGNISNMTEELGKAKETINDIVSSSGNIRIDADGNIKRDTSNLSNALGIGAGAGMVMAGAMNKVADSMKEAGGALQDMSGAGEKSLKELVDHYDKLYKTMEKSNEKIRSLNSQIGTLEFGDNNALEYGHLHGELSSVESQIDVTKWAIEDLNKEMEKNRKIIEGNTTSINKQSGKIKEYRAAIEELENSQSDNSAEIEAMTKAQKDYIDKIEETKKRIDDLQKTMNSQHENSLEGQIEKIREEMKKCQQIMNDITDESGDWGSVLVSGNLESAITKINKYLEEYLEITKKVNDEQDKAKNTDNIEDQIKAYKDLLDVYEEAQKKIQAMDNDTMLARFGLNDQISNFEDNIERATDRLEEFKEELNSGNLDDAGIERVTKSIKEIEEQIKSYMDSIEKFNSIKLNSKSFIDEFRAGDYTIIIDNIEKLKKALVDLEEHKEVDLDLDFDDMTKSLEGAIDAYNKYLSSFDEFNSYNDKYKEARSEYYKYYREEEKLLKEQKKAYEEAGGFLGEWARQAKIAHGNKDLLTDSEKIEAEIKKLTKDLKSYEEALKAVDDTLDLLNDDSAAKTIDEYNEAIERSKQLMDKAIDKMLEYVQKNADLGNELKRRENDLDELTSEYKSLTAEISKLQRELDKEQQKLRKGNEETKEKLAELEKQSNLYTVLRRDVEKFLKSEENGIIAKERLAKAFEKVTESMKDMNNEVKETDKLPDDLLEKVYKDAENLRKSLDLVDFSLVKEGLNDLGDAIKDKTDKLKNFNQLNKELSDTSRAVMLSLEKQGKSIKDFADGAGYALELFKNGEVGIIGNEKALERQRQLLDENAEAIKKFMKQVEDAGGKIPQRFLGDDGQFDEFKYLKELENYGKPMNQLIAQAKSYRQEILENLKYEKESIENKRKLAKETLEQAQANQKAAESQMEVAKQAEREASTMEEQAQAYAKIKKAQAELTKTTQELLKAAKDYDDINDKSVDNKRIQNAKDLVKQYNEQAEALRKLGAAVKDIELDDIRDFDKSLGSSLKDILDIDNDVPKKFRDFAEDIKAMLTELGDFDFGGAGDILKDLGKGLLDALPADIKAATVMFTGLTTAVNKLYQAGKQQFFEGLTNIGSKLEPIIDLFRDFGQEVVSAFESITDTDVDLSSLMELGPNFEYNMQKVGAIAGSNKRQLEELTKTAEVLGGTTQYTASDVAEAFQYMAMAGYDTEAMLSSINGTLALSIASGTGLAETTDIVTDYMTALGLEANSTNDFVDKLAATVTSSNTTVEKYGMSMRQVASQAGALGINMTDLSTAIGLQANAGVKGAKAGTALKNVLANMAAPTEKQEKALKKLGFTADETGSYFKTTADGAVDLEATVKQLMTSTDKMTKSQKAAVLAQLAGREALPGLMALLSQGAEGWDELSATIENSTGKVQYWNECMSLAGKSGKEAIDAINNMKEVFAEVETEALNAGLSSEELSHAIAILGDDGKVTSDNVRQLVDVIDSMNTATGKAEEKWRALDQAGDDFVNTGYDYDATIAKITADTTGLSQATKESIKSKLNENMTYEEANAVLKEYGLTAEKVSFSTLSYADKLEYLRDNLKGCSDEYIKQQLANLGLADSFDEVKEVVSMTDEEFAAYKQNLETVKGMAEQLAEAMDETTKSSLLNLASAIENVAITAFNKIKPALKGAVDAINEFFDTWHNGDKNVFTFDGLEMAFVNLAGKIIEQKGKIQQAVADLFSGLDRFVNGGTLDNILNIGTHLVDSICKGIQQAKDSGSLDKAIDGAIKKICNWITTNGPQIEEAGKTIIDSLKSGIERNSESISAALDTLCSVINTWASSSAQLESTAALFADKFVDSFVENTTKGFANKGGEIIQAITSVLNPGMSQHYPEGQGKTEPTEQEEFFAHNAKGGFLVDWIKGGIQKAKEWLFGESYAAELGEEVGTQVTEGYNNKLVEGKETTNATANEIGTGISEGIGNALLSMDVSQLQLLQTEMTNLQTTTATVATGIATSFTNIQNSARTSFMGLTNIIRNQLLNCTNIVRNQALNMSNIFRNQFVNMANIARNQFVNVANIVRNQMVNCANIVRNQCVNMANIFRNQFVSMANVARNQMVNVSNIIRNQAISWSNVIRNQVTNARNSFTQQMLSMAAVARTQMVNVSNIVRNQATQWASVVRSQAANMKSAFTSAFSGLSSIAASQMAKCLSVVRSYMSQIRAATAQKMTMSFSVNRTITTTNVTKTKTVPASAAYAMRAVNNSMFALAAPTALATTSSNVSGNGTGIGIHGNTSGSLALEIPVVLDGREIARASSKYSQAELAKLEKRGKRKRGE